MNLELTTTIRTAINNTLSSLRPPVSGTHLPEATRAALQTHLDALLKAELQALTSPAPDADLTEKISATLTVDTSDLHAELCRIQAAILERKADRATGRASLADVIKDPLGRTYIDPRKDALWYPDDSGEWVEVPDDCVTCPVPEDTVVGYLLRMERENKAYVDDTSPVDALNWGLHQKENGRIVAYKVVKPCEYF